MQQTIDIRVQRKIKRPRSAVDPFDRTLKMSRKEIDQFSDEIALREMRDEPAESATLDMRRATASYQIAVTNSLIQQNAFGIEGAKTIINGYRQRHQEMVTERLMDEMTLSEPKKDMDVDIPPACRGSRMVMMSVTAVTNMMVTDQSDG
jgi:hypothetical protein